MILGIEIAATICGLWMLIAGKTIGSRAFAHIQLRFLGAFLITLLPVAFLAVMVYSVIFMIQHPSTPQEKLREEIRWPAMGIEFGIAIVYAIVWAVWEKAIRRKTKPQA